MYLLPGKTSILEPADILIAAGLVDEFADNFNEAFPTYESDVTLDIEVLESTADHPEVEFSIEY